MLSAQACSAGADVSTAIQVLDVSSGWFDAGIVNGQNKLVPSVTFKLKNVSDRPVTTLQANLLFHRVNSPEEWGSGFLKVAGSEGLAPGADDRSAHREIGSRLYRHRNARRHAEELPVRRRQGPHPRQGRVQLLAPARRVPDRAAAPRSMSSAAAPARTATAPQLGLVRQLGTLSATALVVSNMIGTGIFTTTGFLAGDLGDPALVVGIWFVGAALALAGALCYAELGSNFPRSGGEYVYLSEAWGPAWGFIDGWVSFFAGFSAPIATTALAISAYLAYFSPALSTENVSVVSLGFVQLRLGGATFLACAIVAAFTAVNVIGVSQVAKLQNVLTATKLAVIGAFLLLGFTIGQRRLGHLSQEAARTSTSSLATQFATSLIFVFFAAQRLERRRVCRRRDSRAGAHAADRA